VQEIKFNEINSLREALWTCDAAAQHDEGVSGDVYFCA
jgi:hypothetical protein